MKDVWLTTAYFGPLEYYRLLAGAETAWVEACENYEKQSWRNRMKILSANGPIILSIPVIRGASPGQPVKEVRIDYRQNWQKIHFRSIESAYRHSPYYEYLIDDLMFLWEIRPEFLFDYNLMAMDVVLKMMKSGVKVKTTSDYREPGFYGVFDYRYLLHPKLNKEGTGLSPMPYHQVFSDRYGFVQDLSILDWLFNVLRT